jgi:hypothetical protein
MNLATSLKSLSLPFVHDPMNATSIFVPLIGAPASNFMYANASSVDSRCEADFASAGLGTISSPEIA